MLRALKRSVAKKNMKDEGYVHFTKGKPSFFSIRWRDFVTTENQKHKRRSLIRRGR